MLRDKLDFVEDKYLRQDIVWHIERGSDYVNLAPIEKFRYADRMMRLTRNYYCNMFNISRHRVNTYFVYGYHGGGCRLDEKEGYSSFGVTVDKVMKCDSPLDLFRTCAHEMRHVYQCLVLDKLNPEQNRNYPYAVDDMSEFLWYSSNCENMADKFSFEETLKFAKESALKFDKDRVPLLDLFNLKVDSLQSRALHVSCKTAYDVINHFKPFDKDEDYLDGNQHVNVFTQRQIEELADEIPEVMWQECKKNSIEDNTQCVAEEVIDLFGKYVKYLEEDKKSIETEKVEDSIIENSNNSLDETGFIEN